MIKIYIDTKIKVKRKCKNNLYILKKFIISHSFGRHIEDV